MWLLLTAVGRDAEHGSCRLGRFIHEAATVCGPDRGVVATIESDPDGRRAVDVVDPDIPAHHHGHVTTVGRESRVRCSGDIRADQRTHLGAVAREPDRSSLLDRRRAHHVDERPIRGEAEIDRAAALRQHTFEHRNRIAAHLQRVQIERHGSQRAIHSVDDVSRTGVLWTGAFGNQHALLLRREIQHRDLRACRSRDLQLTGEEHGSRTGKDVRPLMIHFPLGRVRLGDLLRLPASIGQSKQSAGP